MRGHSDSRSGPAGPRPGFGLGWRLGHVDGEPFAFRLGGGARYRAELRVYPKLGHAVAVLANETSSPRAT